MHESTDIQADLAPERLVVGLENDPLGAVIQTGLKEQRQPPDGNVFPLRTGLVVTLQGARAPHHVAVNSELSQAIDALDVQIAVFQVGQVVLQADAPVRPASIPAGAFHTPRVASVAA